MVRGQLEPAVTSHERGLLKFPLAETSYKRAIPLIHPLGDTYKFSRPVSPTKCKYSRFICLPVWSLIGGVQKERSATTPEGWGFIVHLSICLQHRWQTGSTGTPICNSLSACRWHPPSCSWWMIGLFPTLPKGQEHICWAQPAPMQLSAALHPTLFHYKVVPWLFHHSLGKLLPR